MHFSQVNPLVTNKPGKSFKDIVLENNKSDKYPGHFQELFRRVTVNEFKLLKLF